MAARTLSVLPSSSHSSYKIPSQSSSLAMPRNLRPDGSVNSFHGQKLSLISSSNLCSPHHNKRRRCSVVQVFLALPTANPERASNDKTPKWSAKAIKAFVLGELQAKRLEIWNTRTETLLMGILLEGTSLASQFLRANGITLSKVREEFVLIFGDDTSEIVPIHPPLDESAQRALDWAVDEKLKSGESGEINPTHLLLGIWSEKESEGHKIMATLGFNDDKAKELAKHVNEER